ncbi:MAG: hypothetical protein ACRDTG_14675 [Pseudonocardiaceae bacterium]
MTPGTERAERPGHGGRGDTLWRVELDPPMVTTYEIGHADRYRVIGTSDHLKVTEPFDVDLPLADLLPRWAGRGDGPRIPNQG